MVKKISVLFLVVILILAMSININAQFLVTTFNPPNIIGGDMQTVNSTTAIYNMKIYPYDYAAEKTFSAVNMTSPLLIGLWHSIILPDTVYKFSIEIDMHNTPTGNTGSLQESNFQFFSIVSQNVFNKLDASKVAQTQAIQAQAITALPSDYYSYFWDKTSGMLSVVFCIPETYYTSHISDYTHCYLITALGNAVGASLPADVSLQEYTGVYIQGAYSDVLNEISNKLEIMASGQGGLTEEQVNQAVQDALTAHDNQLEQEVSGMLDLILEQISGITDPYKQAVDQITGALNNVSNIFAANDYDSKLTLPAATNPLAGNAVLWQAQEIDLGAAYLSLPSTFRALLQYTSRAAVLIAALREVINIIKYAIIGRGEQVD